MPVCRGIRKIRLSNCPRLKDEHLKALKLCPSTLKHLMLENCTRVTLSVVSFLPQDISLHSLTFKNCASSAGSLPEHVSALTQLTQLDLSGHELSDSDIPTLIPLTLLKSLDISGSKLSQEGVDQLSVLSALTFLDISWTLAQHPPPLSALHTLRMDSCDFGGSWDFAYAVHASMSGSEGTLFAQIEQLSLNSCRFEAEDGSQVGLCCFFCAPCCYALQHKAMVTCIWVTVGTHMGMLSWRVCTEPTQIQLDVLKTCSGSRAGRYRTAGIPGERYWQ